MDIESAIKENGLPYAVISNWEKLQRTRPEFLATLSEIQLQEIFSSASACGARDVRVALWPLLKVDTAMSTEKDPFGNSYWVTVICIGIVVIFCIACNPKIQQELLDSLPSVLTLC